MSSQSVLDKTYHIIIQRMIKTGQAPHYTEIAAELGVPVEDGRKALHDLCLSESQVSGYFLILIISAVLHRSATFQPSIGSQSAASKSGLVSEVLSRWQYAGFFQVSW